MSNLNAAIQVLAGGAGPGAFLNVTLYASPITVDYIGATGDVVRFDYSYDGTRPVTGVSRTLQAVDGGEISFTVPDGINYIRCEVTSGNSGATASASATGGSLTAAKPTVALTVNNTPTPGAWADCRAFAGPRSILYEGFSGDSVYIEGSDSAGGGALPFQVYPASGSTSITGASWIATIDKIPNYMRVVRPSGTTAGALCGVIQAITTAGQAGGGGASPAVVLDTLAVADTAASGFMGGLSAAASVDLYSAFSVNQATAAVVLTLRDPTVATATRLVYITNAGAVLTYAYGQAIPVGATGVFFWNGAIWEGANVIAQGGNSGPVAFGSLDNSVNVIANGVSFVGATPSVPNASFGIQATTWSAAILSGTGGTFFSSTGTHDFQGGAGTFLRVLPSGVAAGQVGGIVFRELAANGTNYAGWGASDNTTASAVYQMPAAPPTLAGQSLRSAVAVGGLAQTSWGGAVNVNATKSSAQTITDGGGATPITGYTEVTDTASAFDPAAGTFTAPATGFYDITASVEFAATAANVGALFQCGIAVDGAIVANATFANPVAALAQVRSLTVSRALQLTVGQVVSVRVQLSGAGGNIATTATATNNGLSIFQV